MGRLFGTLVLGGASVALVLTAAASAWAELPPVWNCSDDEDCTNPGEPYCDTLSGECVACIVDAHCEADFVCHRSQCIPKCFGDEDCAAPEGYCSDEGVCLECLVDGHCAPDEPLCLVEPGVGECVGCIVDEDCGADQPWCSWDNTCVECIEHEDCAEDAYCLETVCMPDVCEAGARSCSEDKTRVVECNEWGAGTFNAEVCPNADCEAGECGLGGTGSEDTGTDTGASTTVGGTEAPEDPGVLAGRGCGCTAGDADEGAPLGGLGLVVLALVGAGRRGRGRGPALS